MEREQRMTQTAMVLQYLDDYGSVTAWEAMRDLGIMRLASRIHEIRKSGIAIDGKVIKTRNRYGKKIHYTIYRKAS